MKRSGIILTVLAFIAVYCLPVSSSASPDRKKEKSSARTIYGSLINSATSLGMTDSIKVELLSRDSVLVDYVFPTFYYDNYPDQTSVSTGFTMYAHCKPGSYILRLSHPDYESVAYPLEIDRNRINAGTLQIRKLSRFEKAVMLGEVTVVSSKVQFVNRGDTISYNADAFDVAQGSMLDALLQQMPGVQLRENGQIYVNGRFVDKLLLDGKDFFRETSWSSFKTCPPILSRMLRSMRRPRGRQRYSARGPWTLTTLTSM